jgi:deoxyribodipyrimidine photo-lyase
MSELFQSKLFEPTLAAARARIAAVRPSDYARTRNFIDGAVSRLSPYITHGFVSLPELLSGVRRRHEVPDEHKFVSELGWREYFHHVWRHEGERIFTSLHAGPVPEEVYSKELPEDVRTGATGVPVVDFAVRALYETGWLHNHARMWLASYVVHLRKIHWRVGADWMYGHLLDGDLASNHLSWQWVAGTGSSKPYLFNAENVARYAPANWHSERTPVDASYEVLERIARGDSTVDVEGGEAIEEPALTHVPPPDLLQHNIASPIQGAWIVHPWALGEIPTDHNNVVSVFPAQFHKKWGWSERRWRFVAARMAAMSTGPVWWEGDLPENCVGVADPHLGTSPSGWIAPARMFEEPGVRCMSFWQYWKKAGNRSGTARLHQ